MMKKIGKCVHFNGTINACCKAGVNYKELAGPGDAYIARLPCHTNEYLQAGGLTVRAVGEVGEVAACDKRQEPTAEEVAADEHWLEQRMGRIGKVRDAIVAHCGGPWKKGQPSVGGSIPCPCCGGNVRFTRSGYNGHVHARCSTEGCAAWME